MIEGMPSSSSLAGSCRTLLRFASNCFTASFICLVVVAGFQSAMAQSDSLARHYRDANRFLRSGDQDRATSEFRLFIAEALRRMANAKAELGDFDVAFSYYSDARTLSPEDVGLQFDYAEACLDADRPVEARAVAQTVAEKAPSADSRRLYGRALFHMGEFPAAQVQLERAYGEKPEFNTGYLLGKTYLLLNQEGKARTLFAAMTVKFGDTAPIHVLLGQAYSETDHDADAIQQFQIAAARDDHAHDVHYYWGMTYLGHNESAGYDKAIPQFRAELIRNKDDYRSHYMLGYIALKERQFQDAESELEIAHRLAPQDLQATLDLAQVFVETGRDSPAENLLRASLATEKSSSQMQVSRIHYLLGRILQKHGGREEAIREFQIVAEIQKKIGPNSAQIQDPKTKEANDSTKPAAPDPGKAAQLENFVADLRPALSDTYNSLGAIQATRGDFAQATIYFQDAAKWAPTEDDDIDRNLGRAAFMAGEFERAVAPLSHYLSRNPGDAMVRGTLGLTLFRLNRYTEVVDVLGPMHASLASDPDLMNAYSVSLSKSGAR